MSPLLPLGLCAAALAGVLVLEIRAGSPSPLPRPLLRPIAAPAPAGPDSDAPSTPDNDALNNAVQTIIARPLLEPKRRPPDVPQAAAQGPTAAEALPRLAGVIVTPSDRRAIFAPASGKPLVATEGARVAGFVLEHIGPDGVTMSGAGGQKVLRPSHAQPQAHP
jgi:hypothetical protein